MRRESDLFALLGTLLLAFNFMQPLAFAGQIQQGVWSTCKGSVGDAGSDGDTDTPLGECPVCSSGLCASVSASQEVLQLPSTAFSAPLSEAAPAWNNPKHPVCSSRAGRSQAIRGPPFSV